MNTNKINSVLKKAGFKKATKHLTAGLINYDGFWAYKAGDSILVENRVKDANIESMLEILEQAGYKAKIDSFTHMIEINGKEELR